MIAILVTLAGALGAVTRFVVDGAARRRLPGTFPWPTVAINVTGSLALGVLTGVVLFHDTGTDLRLVAGTGFCGGYTTFSTAMFETVRLVQRGAFGQALGNWLGTAGLAVGAAALGLVIAR